jgi:NTP pyrophosphatase (non-canonical NTP hydrolase)
MAMLTEEVGEVARIIARRYGEQSEKESDKNKDLGEEMADVLFVLICLANQTGVDLQEAFKWYKLAAESGNPTGMYNAAGIRGSKKAKKPTT